MFVKQFTDFFLFDVDRGQNNMTGRFVSQLHNSLTQIRIDDFNSVSLEERIEMTFFGQHGFAFNDLARAMPSQNSQHDLIVFR